MALDDVVEGIKASGARDAVPLHSLDADDRRVPGAVSDDGREIASTEERLVVAQLIGLLPAIERDIIQQSFFAERTEAEIDASLGCSQSTVSRRRRHALDRLRLQNPDDVTAA